MTLSLPPPNLSSSPIHGVFQRGHLNFHMEGVRFLFQIARERVHIESWSEAVERSGHKAPAITRAHNILVDRGVDGINMLAWSEFKNYNFNLSIFIYIYIYISLCSLFPITMQKAVMSLRKALTSWSRRLSKSLRCLPIKLPIFTFNFCSSRLPLRRNT